MELQHRMSKLKWVLLGAFLGVGVCVLAFVGMLASFHLSNNRVRAEFEERIRKQQETAPTKSAAEIPADPTQPMPPGLAHRLEAEADLAKMQAEFQESDDEALGNMAVSGEALADNTEFLLTPGLVVQSMIIEGVMPGYPEE